MLTATLGIQSKHIHWIGLLVALVFFSCNSLENATEPEEKAEPNKYLLIGKLDSLDFHVVHSVETPCWLVTRPRYNRLGTFYIDSGSTCVEWGPLVGEIQDTLRAIESLITGSGFFEILLPHDRIDSTWNKQYEIYRLDEQGVKQGANLQGPLLVEWTNRALYLPVNFTVKGPQQPDFFPPAALGLSYRIELIRTGSWIAE